MNTTLDPFDSNLSFPSKVETIDYFELAKELKDLNDSAFDCLNKNNSSKTEEILQNLYSLFSKHTNGFSNKDFRLQQGRFFNIVGIKHWVQQQYQKAFLHYTTALEIFEVLENDYFVALVCNNIGNLQRYLGNYKSAIDYFKIAIRKLEAADELENRSRTYLNLGILYQTLELYDAAEETLLKALVIAEQIQQIDTIAACYQQLSILTRIKKDYVLCLDYAKKSLELFKSINNQVGEIETMSSIANTYYSQGAFEEAFEKYFEILSLTNSKEFRSQQGNIYLNIAKNIQTVLKENKQIPTNDHDYGYYAQKAYDIAIELDIIELQADACILLAEYCEQKNDHIASVKFYKEYLQLSKEQQLNESKITAEQFELESTLAELEKKSLIVQTSLKATKELLFKILPENVATRLISGENPIADYIPSLSVVFIDIVGFTSIAKTKEATTLVSELNDTFSQLDRLAKVHSIEKVKTIGDAYMAVGYENPNLEHHSCRIIRYALFILESVETTFQFRIGIHSGPVVAGVIGLERFSYDLWGDTVNVAQRLEATSETSTIHISEQTYLFIKDTFDCKFVGNTSLKGIGLVNTYHVLGEKAKESE